MNIPGINNNAPHTTVVNGLQTTVAVNQLQQSTAAAFQAQAPAKPQAAPDDIRQLNKAFDQFMGGRPQLLINIGQFARDNPESIPSISQAYIDVFGDKLSELGVSPKWVEVFLGSIAEINGSQLLSDGAKVRNLSNIALILPHMIGVPDISPHPGVGITDNTVHRDAIFDALFGASRGS